MRRADPSKCFDFREYEKSGQLKRMPLPTDDSYERWFDTGCDNLMLEFRKTGKRFKDIRKIRGETKRPTIGEFPHMTVTEARNAVKTKTITLGLSKNDNKPTVVEYTIQQVYDKFIEQRRIEGKQDKIKDKTDRFYVNLFDNHIAKQLGSLTFDKLTYDGIDNWHVAIANRKDNSKTSVVANRAKTLLGNIWEYAILSQKTKATINMAKLVDRFKEKPRKLFIPFDILPVFWTALADEKQKYYDYYRVLCLCGQRKNEVLNMTWDQLHLDDQYPHWGPYDGKYDPESITYLSTHVVKILKGRMSITGDSPYVFPGHYDTNQPMSLPKDVYDRVCEKAGLWVKGGDRNKNLTKHDLRRTFGTVAERLVTERMKKRCLNHKLNKDSTDRYGQPQPQDILPAMQAINDEIIRLATAKSTLAIAS